MGSLVGHVVSGVAFFLLGLWHLFNNMKLHVLHSNTYVSSPWYPASSFRYLELLVIIIGAFLAISMELVIGPSKHQPFDPDGSIPSNHLHNFEHSSISLSFMIYAVLAITIDRIRPHAYEGLTQLLAALAFAQEFLLFHFHSADHMGVEGQYHSLLQIVILVCLITTLMGISLPKSFLVSFVRSASILLQGLWIIVMGIMLYTPALIPKGCFMNREDGHHVVRCHGDPPLRRAKSLVNLQFSWLLSGFAICSMLVYLTSVKKYGGEKVQYWALGNQEDEEDIDDTESRKKRDLEQSKNFAHIGNGPAPMYVER